MRRLALAALAPALAGCPADGEPGVVRVDPAFFEAQRFDCDEATAAPPCPPSSCAVDESGAVVACEPSCGVGALAGCTVFTFDGGDGADLCAPASCAVDGPGEPPSCDASCAEDDVTCYVFGFSCGQ